MSETNKTFKPRNLTSSSQLQVTSNNNTLITYTEPYFGTTDTITVDNTNNFLETYIEPYNNLLAIDSSVNQLSTYIDPYNNLLAIDGSVNQLETVIDPYNNLLAIDGSVNQLETVIDPYNNLLAIDGSVNQLETVIDPYNILLAIDGSVNQLSTVINPYYPSSVTIDNTNNKWITYIDGVPSGNVIVSSGQTNVQLYTYNTSSGGGEVTIFTTIPAGTYTLSGLASTVQAAIQAQPGGGSITVDWNVTSPNRYTIKSPTRFLALAGGSFDVWPVLGFDESQNPTFPPFSTSFTANNAPTQTSLPNTNVYIVSTVPNGTYTYTTLASAMTTAYSGYNITVTYDSVNQRFVYNKSSPGAGLFQFVSSYLVDTTTIDSIVGNMNFGVSANPQITNLTPISGTGITAVIMIPNNPTAFQYTETSLATAITTAYTGYSPSINITCSWNAGTQRFVFTKSPVVVGDPALFRFNACSIETRIGTLPKITSLSTQTTSTAPNYTPYPGTGITAVLTIPNNPTPFEYTQTSLATAITTAYSGFSPSINITCTWNAGTQRFVFTKSPVVVGDPALFRFNACSIESRIGTLPKVTSLSTQTTSTAPNYTPYPGTGITAVVIIPNSPNAFEYTQTSLATAITTAYTSYSPSINITCSWNTGTQRFVFTKSPVVVGDPALFRFNACSIETRIGTLPKITSLSTQTTSTAPNYTAYPGTGFTAVFTIPNNPTAFEYTETSLATAITNAYTNFSPSINITCTWNSGTQRFVFTKSSVVVGDPALFRFNSSTIANRMGTLPTISSANPQTTSTAPNYTPYPGTGITVVFTIPNNPTAFEYTPTSLATAITNAYSANNIGIICSWNSLTQRFVFTKFPVQLGDPGLFRFNASSIAGRIGTLPTVSSTNPQTTSTAPIYTPYPSTGITVSCIIANNNTYTPTELASAISVAYTSATPSPVNMSVVWNSGIQRFVFTKAPITTGDPGLFRFENTSTLNAAIGNLEYVVSTNPQQTLSDAFFKTPLEINFTNNSLSTYIDPYNNLLPIDNTNNLLVTDIDPVNSLLPIDGANNSLVVYVDPLSVMTVDSSNFRFRFFYFSPLGFFNIDIPQGVYLPTTYASTFTSICSSLGIAVTLSFSGSTFVLAAPFNMVVGSSGQTSSAALTLTGFVDDNNATIVAPNPPTTTTYLGTNVTVSVTIPNSPTIFDYTAVNLANVMQSALTTASLGISVTWNSGTQRYTFTKAPLLAGDPGLFRFTGASTINTRIGTLPTVSSANPQTTSTAPVFTTYPGTGIIVSFNVPNNSGYTGPTLASAITNAYTGYSPIINITCTYNFSTQRFDFTKLPVAPGDPALFKFDGGSTINTRIGTLPTVTSSNNQSTSTTPLFTTNPETGITINFTIPDSPNNYQYIPTQLANQINLAYANYIPSIGINCKWDSVIQRFVFTKNGLDINDPGLFRFTTASTINSIIGGLPTVVSANPQTTLSIPNFGIFPGTGEVIILNIPTGIYNPEQLAQAITTAYNTYFPSLPLSIFEMTVSWEPQTQRFIFYKTPIGSSDPGNFQFLYSYNPITTITQLIGSLPFGISGNPLTTTSNPTSPPVLFIPDGELVVDKGELNVILKVYPK